MNDNQRLKEIRTIKIKWMTTPGQGFNKEARVLFLGRTVRRVVNCPVGASCASSAAGELWAGPGTAASLPQCGQLALRLPPCCRNSSHHLREAGRPQAEPRETQFFPPFPTFPIQVVRKRRGDISGENRTLFFWGRRGGSK